MTQRSFQITSLYSEEEEVAQPEQQKPVVIELTRKRYKLGMLIGTIVMWLSILGTLITLAVEPILSVFGFLGIGLGYVVYGVSRFLAWWNHG